jgi:hypothetical protein
MQENLAHNAVFRADVELCDRRRRIGAPGFGDVELRESSPADRCAELR